MADRTHDEENALTGAGTSRTKPSSAERGQPTGGTDGDDRTAEGQGRGATRRENGRSQDEFMSSEVNDRTPQPMKDSKTRS